MLWISRLAPRDIPMDVRLFPFDFKKNRVPSMSRTHNFFVLLHRADSGLWSKRPPKYWITECVNVCESYTGVASMTLMRALPKTNGHSQFPVRHHRFSIL